MKIAPIILSLPFICVLGSCTTIYNIHETKIATQSRHESLYDTDSEYEYYASKEAAAASTTTKESPKVVAPSSKQTLSCAVSAAPKLVEDRLTKEELATVSSEKELMALVAKHIKSLETSIEAHNKAIDSHNRQLLRCQPN